MFSVGFGIWLWRGRKVFVEYVISHIICCRFGGGMEIIMRNKKIFYLLFFIVVFLCCACGKENGDNYKKERQIINEVDETKLQEDEMFDITGENVEIRLREDEMPEILERQPQIYYDSYEALGNFSEGLALVRRQSDGRLAYIDKNGDIKIVLEEQYKSATEFNNGRAVLCTGEKFFLSGNPGHFSWELKGDYDYSMIDTEGNVIVEPGIYQFIGKTAEEKTFIYQAEESYQGTKKIVGFIDLNGKLLFEMDASPYIYYDGSKSGLENIFFYCGTAVLKNINMRSQDIIDDSGNIIQQIGKGTADEIRTFNTNLCILDTAHKKGWGDIQLYNRSINEIELLPSGNIETYIKYSYFEPTHFVEGYALVIETDPNLYHKTFLFVDNAGNVVSVNKDLSVSYFKRTLEDAWILELQNDYWGIVDHEGQLLFEPVQEEIISLGEGLFYGENSKAVFDKYGEQKFISDGIPYESIYAESATSLYPYSEGLIIVNVNGTNRFMDLQGNILWETVEITDSL